ncbi:MAG: oligosaccharide repeat unit polymerase [Bacteroidales bacterium]|nr:oligosaccharide repeat unit polymerase [Bacteroidales bacterium]
MIFLLDLILVLNLFLAFKYFKSLVAPAVLMGFGMLIAALISTLHYETWEMSNFSPLSVLILGGCPFLFTIFCIIFSRFCTTYRFTKRLVFDLETIDWYALKIFYLCSIFVFVFHVMYIYLMMKNYFHIDNFSELLMARRADYNSDETLFELPFISKQFSFIFNILTIISIWLFFLIKFYIPNYKKITKKIQYYIIVLTILRVTEGLFTGAKGNVLPVFFYFFFFYILFYYSSIGMFETSTSLKKVIFLGLFFGALFFSSFNMIIGRNINNYNNSFELISEYCGAEIKNFDIYLDRNFKSTNGFGAHTFAGIYRWLHPDATYQMYRFESVNGYSLGNVYTQFGNIHVDFGSIGSFVMVLFMALVITFIYNRALILINNPVAINVWVIIYCWIMYQIFFCFFAGQFTSQLFGPGGIKYGIGALIFLFFFKKIMICNQRKLV